MKSRLLFIGFFSTTISSILVWLLLSFFMGGQPWKVFEKDECTEKHSLTTGLTCRSAPEQTSTRKITSTGGYQQLLITGSKGFTIGILPL